MPNCVLSLWTGSSGRYSVCREEAKVIDCKKGGAIYNDSYAGNLFFFIILWFIGGGCNEKS